MLRFHGDTLRAQRLLRWCAGRVESKHTLDARRLQAAVIMRCTLLEEKADGSRANSLDTI
jgi:hypothetical protein